MTTQFGLEKMDGTTLGRIEDVLHLREASNPDPRRTEVIRGIQIIREKLAKTVMDGEGGSRNEFASEKLAELVDDLASLERTSLGTSNAYRVRSAAAPSGVAEILDRHEKSWNSYDASKRPDYSGAGPTVLRILLGSYLRRLREAAGITRIKAAVEIFASESKICRIELGRNPIRQRDLFDLLRLYDVGPEESDKLIDLARNANLPGWWHQYADVLPAWLEPYLGLEGAATLIRVYEAQYVPDLLQTSEYSTGILASCSPWERKMDRYLLIREERKRRFEERRTMLWAVIDESVLYREVGGRQVLLNQLRYLLEVVESSHVCLQIAPISKVCSAGYPFTVLRFQEHDLPDVVYVENLTSGIYLDKESDLNYYRHTLDELLAVSSSPGEAPGIITEVIRRLERGMTLPGNLPRK